MPEILPAQQRMLNLRDLLKRSEAQFAAAMPKHLSVERLIRVALTNVRLNPRLLDCEPQSFLGALMIAAQLGLEPDGVSGLAYLIPRKNGKRSRAAGRDIYECCFQPGYKGLTRLAQNSGQIASMRMDVVRAKDFFEFEKGLSERLVHRPARDGFDQPITDVYAIVRTKNGGTYWDCWSTEKVEAHRARYSKDGREDSVWNTNWDVMASKSVLIAVLKLCPKSIELQLAINAQERSDEGLGMDGLLGLTGEDLAVDDGAARDDLPAADPANPAAPAIPATTAAATTAPPPTKLESATARVRQRAPPTTILAQLHEQEVRLGGEAWLRLLGVVGGDPERREAAYGLAESEQRALLDAARQVR